MQAAPPALPFMSRLRRLIEHGFDSSFIQFVGIRFGGSAVFTAAVARKHELDSLLELRHVLDL